MGVPAYESKVPYNWELRKRYLDLPFPLSEYQSRVGKIRKAMEKENLDALLVFGSGHDCGDLVYLSNFIPFGRAALLVRKNGELAIVTDGILHGEPINSYSWMTWIEDFRPVHRNPDEFASALTSILREDGAKHIGVVGMDQIPVPIWQSLQKDGTEWTDFWAQYTQVKSIRSDLEVALLKETGRITSRGMEAAIARIDQGVTEHAVAAAANEAMFEEGAHNLFFPTIVNGGPRGGLKHSYPTGRKFQRGDLVYLDMGAMKYGYNCDMSRSVVVGKTSKEQQEVLDVIVNAYNTLKAMMQPGTATSQLMEAAKELERQSGLWEKYEGRIFLGLGIHHAVGTSIAEFPTLGFADTILAPNMTFAFEPMAHILDFGTAVVEDMILITKSGAEPITHCELVHW